MILGIDASNIRAGGGVTHLQELLAAAEPERQGFGKVVVWASAATLARLAERPWLKKATEPILERDALRRALWQSFRLGARARDESCDLLLVPGGSFTTRFRPIATISQNLLPFQWHELLRYGASMMTLKMIALRFAQSWSFRKAGATIFLTEYARRAVLEVCGALPGPTPVIPHGIDPRFVQAPRRQRELAECDEANPFRALYVSAVEPYKHQWQVAEAVAALRAGGMPITLDLIGPANSGTLPKLIETLHRVDPSGSAIRYLGEVPYEALHARYQAADLCVFASSCETIANILIEGMASGLPTACSDGGAMREVLGDAGVYFDPEEPASIAAAIGQLAGSAELRAGKAQLAFERAQRFSWSRCADETFSVLAKLANGGRTGQY